MKHVKRFLTGALILGTAVAIYTFVPFEVFAAVACGVALCGACYWIGWTILD